MRAAPPRVGLPGSHRPSPLLCSCRPAHGAHGPCTAPHRACPGHARHCAGHTAAAPHHHSTVSHRRSHGAYRQQRRLGGSGRPGHMEWAAPRVRSFRRPECTADPRHDRWGNHEDDYAHGPGWHRSACGAWGTVLLGVPVLQRIRRAITGSGTGRGGGGVLRGFGVQDPFLNESGGGGGVAVACHVASPIVRGWGRVLPSEEGTRYSSKSPGERRSGGGGGRGFRGGFVSRGKFGVSN